MVDAGTADDRSRRASRTRAELRELAVGSLCAILGAVLASMRDAPIVVMSNAADPATADDLIGRHFPVVIFGFFGGMILGGFAARLLWERRLPWPLGPRVGQGLQPVRFIPLFVATFALRLMLDQPGHALLRAADDPSSAWAFARLPEDDAASLVAFPLIFSMTSIAMMLIPPTVSRIRHASQRPRRASPSSLPS